MEDSVHVATVSVSRPFPGQTAGSLLGTLHGRELEYLLVKKMVRFCMRAKIVNRATFTVQIKWG